jgi:type VI secretion system protein ImpI
MALTLRIDNETSLPDGGPLSIAIQGKRGIDIGRDSHLDWTLPDPTRVISGKHCEIRYKDGAYWLHDVSTNGTFLNGANHRMQSAHRLRNGDRFAVGKYIIAVTADEGASQSDAASASARPVDYQELWANQGEIAPPIDSKQLRPPAEFSPPVHSDFLDWAADVPNPVKAPQPPRATGRGAESNADPDMGWAFGRPSYVPAPPPASPPMPTPRRPARGRKADSLWDDESPTEETASRFVAERMPAADTPPGVPGSPGFASSAGAAGSSEEFLRQLAKSAGIPEELLRQKDQAELAQQLGSTLRIVTENLMQLLSARAQTKRLARSSSHTMVGAIDNNPLKFAPSAEDALRIMFGPTTRSYLDTQRAVEQSFEDLKSHQIKTYSAMQHALSKLMADLAPQAIEQTTEDDRGIASLLTSRKAKLWEAYVARWQAKVDQGDSGPIEAFMLYFAEYYDRDGG